MDIDEILIKDDINGIIQDFIDDDLQGTESLIMIWQTKDGMTRIASAGTTQIETLGLLEIAKDLTLKD